LMVESIYLNSGRGCINCSGVWASRHTREIADALAERLGPIEALPPENPKAGLAAFTVPGMGAAVWKQIEQDIQLPGVTHVTEKYGSRLVEKERASYLRPTILHVTSPESPAAQKEYMFPFASVVECPQAEMIKRIGATLVGTVITNDESLRNAAVNATNIDRLNLGPIPTTKLNWLQPHEGNMIDFLFRGRALQAG
jgi:acyl-CoA reductase-like NAD-dependent aldehyde dehydrogenase